MGNKQPLRDRLIRNRKQRERHALALVLAREALRGLLAEGVEHGKPPKWLRAHAGLTRSQVQRVREGRLPRPWEVTNDE